MYTITFYSFEGGVGRTLALVNVAAELAKMGRKVLLVDFDLESPGLDTVERLRPPQPHPGVVEYVTAYHLTQHVPPVSDYIYPVAPFGDQAGRIWIMPAGRRDAEYRLALAQLDWIDLYRHRDGFDFFEKTKAAWQAAYELDYVLIDCRNGRTNVEGICTRQLPDAVVCVFCPVHHHHLGGLKEVCAEIRGETERGRATAINLHFAMRIVPALEEEDQVRNCTQAVCRELGIRQLAATIHQPTTTALLHDPRIVLHRPRSRLGREYRKLVEAIITANPIDRVGVLRFLDHLQRCYSSGVVGAEVEVEEQWLQKLIDHFWEDADFLVRAGHCLAIGGRFDDALRSLDRAVELFKIRAAIGSKPPAARPSPEKHHERLWWDPHSFPPLHLSPVALFESPPGMHTALSERAIVRCRLGDQAGAKEDMQTFFQIRGFSASEFLRVALELKREPIPVLPEPVLTAVLTALAQNQYQVDVNGILRALAALQGVPPEQVFEQDDCGMLKSQFGLHILATDHPSRSMPFEALEQQNWRSLIKQLDPRLNDLSADEVFCLALAYMGATGSLRKDLCRLVLVKERQQTERQQPASQVPMRPEDHMRMALVHWRLGESQQALASLREAEDGTTRGEEYLESYWRLKCVNQDQFLEDCQKMTTCIRENKPPEPDFLKKEPLTP